MLVNPKHFSPSLYIGIGEFEHLFTLRETYLHTTYIPNDGWAGGSVLNGVYQGETIHEVRSFHHFNLSQDPAEAFQKALKRSQEWELPLQTSQDDLVEGLNAITRRSPEEMASARAAEYQRTAAQNLAYAEENDARIMQRLTNKGNKWIVGFGKYAENTYSEAISLDRQYFEWILKQNQESDGRYNNDTQSAMIELFLDRIEPLPESQHFGTVGKRTNGIVATVKGCRPFESYYGTSYCFTLVTDAGEELVLFSTADLPEVGKKFSFNAMIKEHGEYRGVKQTTVNRPTKIEELS